jgi:hypothetical protein
VSSERPRTKSNVKNWLLKPGFYLVYSKKPSNLPGGPGKLHTTGMAEVEVE